jgi:uncharacterized membrane protein YphA (DoxX/SURF4 family)
MCGRPPKTDASQPKPALYGGDSAGNSCSLTHLTAWLTIITEIFGGFAILLGAFVALVSVPTILLLAVAIVTVHLPYGFSSIKLMKIVDGRAVRPPWIRVQPALYRLYRGARAVWPEPVVG